MSLVERLSELFSEVVLWERERSVPSREAVLCSEVRNVLIGHRAVSFIRTYVRRPFQRIRGLFASDMYVCT